MARGQHVDELPYSRAGANGGGLHVCQGMDEGLGHWLDALLFVALQDHLTMGEMAKRLENWPKEVHRPLKCLGTDLNHSLVGAEPPSSRQHASQDALRGHRPWLEFSDHGECRSCARARRRPGMGSLGQTSRDHRCGGRRTLHGLGVAFQKANDSRRRRPKTTRPPNENDSAA
jgi:hypothetical protein